MSRRYVDEWSENMLAAWEQTPGDLRAVFAMPSGGDPVAEMMSPAPEHVFGIRPGPPATDPLVGVKKITPTGARCR